jgi:hypothetical protein
MKTASDVRRLMRDLEMDPTKPSSAEGFAALLASHPDREAILDQVRTQEQGIPFEYQFGYLCWWLGRCTHLQFIDPEPEFPPLTRIEGVKHPDIFAVFSLDGSDFPCLVEVKAKKKLEMGKAYVAGLRNHPLAREYPVLIAWKRDEYWTLFDVDTFVAPGGTLKVPFGEAMKASVLSVLAGDFSLRGFRAGVEWRATMEAFSPEAVDALRTGITQKYVGKLVDLSVTDPRTGNSLEFTPALSRLLPYLGGEWDPYERYEGLHVTFGEAVVTESALWASQALLFGVAFETWQAETEPDWKGLLRARSFPFTLDELHRLIRDARSNGMGFEQSPMTLLPAIANPCMKSAQERALQ